MRYYGIVRSGAYLAHHGIKGQHWGIRNGPPYPLSRARTRTKVNAREFNLDRWRKDKDHNILYVTGMSGSGKSTIAKQMGGKNTDVIHLDIYLEQVGEDTKKQLQNKALNAYLDKQNIPFRKLNDGSFSNPASKERFKLIDDFTAATERFGQLQYKRGRGVIMEGVQLSDQTMYPVKDDLKGKPMIILKTGAVQSTFRAARRDGIALYDIPTFAVRLKDQNMWRKNMKKLGRVMK